MKNFLSLLLAILILEVPAYADEKKPEQNTAGRAFRLGIILPLSGPAASIGQSMKNAAMLSHEKLPADIRSRLKLYFEDDKLQPSETVKALTKLLSVDGVDAVLTAGSGPGNATAPLVENAKIPMIAIATDPRVTAGRNYVVSLWMSMEEEARMGVEEAIKRGYKKIGRIVSQTDFSLELAKVFDRINGDRIGVVYDEEVTPDLRDFRTALLKLKTAGTVDAVYVGLYVGQAGLFAKQARQMGIQAPLFSFEIFEESSEIRDSEGALKGQWYINIADPEEHFIKEFKERFPDSSVWGAANAFDAIALTGKALESFDSREGVNAWLHEVKNFTGAMGSYSASGDNRFTLRGAIKEVRD